MQTESIPPGMALALQASFGSVQAWRDQFQACGLGQQGTTRLVLDTQNARLLNLAANTPGPQPCETLLALGPGQHSAEQVDWAAVYPRYQQAVLAAGAGLAAQAQDLAGALVLDVRRAGAFEQAPTMLPGARWADPARVDTWAADLPTETPVVVYCVHGHEVSRATALRLRAAGVQARFLDGGIEAWATAGRAVVPKPGG
jgi:Fe-Mn family superoxide dismutase